MEATRAALDKEHQLQILQMEAINALWKKVRGLNLEEKIVSMKYHLVHKLKIWGREGSLFIPPF